MAYMVSIGSDPRAQREFGRDIYSKNIEIRRVGEWKKLESLINPKGKHRLERKDNCQVSYVG